MATKIGDWYFEVTADNTPALRALDVITLAAKGAAAIISKELVQAGLQFNSAMQRSTALFSGLTDSMEIARDTMREFAGLALDTPIFSTDTLARTAQTLLGFGVAAENVSDFAQTINLAAEALNVGAGGAGNLAYALGQVQSRGHLAGDEVRQLANYSINAWRLVADATGQSIAEVRKLGEEQKLLADDVLPILFGALRDTFGGAGLELLNTFGIQARGLQSIFTALGSAIAEPFIGSFGGGALTDVVRGIRESLRGLVAEGEDGLYVLGGALAPFNDLLRDVADRVADLGGRFSDWLGGIATGDLTGLANTLRTIGSEIGAFTGATTTLLGDLGSDLAAIGPPLRDFLGTLYDVARDALPLIADGIRAVGDIFALVGPQVLTAGNAFLVAFGPLLLSAIEASVAALEIFAFVLEQIDRLAPVAAIAVGLLTTALIAMNTQVAVAAGVRGLQALGIGFASLGLQATAARLTLAGMFPRVAALTGAISGLVPQLALAGSAFLLFGTALDGARGNFSILQREFSAWDPRRYVQDLASLGVQIRGLFGGPGLDATLGILDEAERIVAVFDEATGAAANFDARLLEGANTFAEVRAAALAYGEALGVEDVALFANTVALGWKAAKEGADAAAAAIENVRIQTDGLFAATQTDIYDFLEAADDFANHEIWQVITASGRIIDVPAIENATDLIRELSAVADDAARSVDDLLRPPAGETVDAFLQSLVGLATDVTDALRAPAGALADLDFSVATNSVKQQARDLVNALVDEYGLSLREIENLLDKQGLAGVIEALGTVTEQTTRVIDPLIAKYGQFGATVDLIRTAIRNLNDQRTTAIRAQIDQVEAALRDARQAAEDARTAFDEFFLRGTGGLQGAIDRLVLDIPGIGDTIEAGLLKGGPQGEAMIRQAYGDIGSQLGSIFQLGLEQGLDPSEIIELLTPVYGSIRQEVSGAMNRISSLDWTEGFTPQVASRIQDWLEGSLDPAAIGDLFSDILGADQTVSGLQSQLDDLNAQLRVDVEFSQEQVQAAIGEIQTEIITEPVITEEAAQAVFDEIQKVLRDDELRASIDWQILTRQAENWARETERQLRLELITDLVIDPEALQSLALLAGSEFADVFRERMMEDLRTERESDDISPLEPRPVPDLLDRAAGIGFMTPDQTSPNVTLYNDIKITESSSPRVTASEVVAASSAAAGSGGRYDPARWNSIRIPV